MRRLLSAILLLSALVTARADFMDDRIQIQRDYIRNQAIREAADEQAESQRLIFVGIVGAAAVIGGAILWTKSAKTPRK